MTNTRPRRIKSVLHAFRVFGLFSPAHPRWSVTQISSALRLSKSTVSRLLATMADEGFVLKDPETGRYELGTRAYEVGVAFLSGLSFRRVTLPVLEELAFTVRETVFLGILGEGAAVYIDKILSPLALRVDSHIGVAIPLHATALGKVLLAAQPDAAIELVVSRGLRAYTKRTIVDPTALWREVQAVRRQGFATDLEEFEDNLHCIGFPVRDSSGAVVAAFSVAGPAVRFTREVMRSNLGLFRQAAAEISRRLGAPAGDMAGTRLSPEAGGGRSRQLRETPVRR